MSSTVTGPSRLEFLTVADAAEELHVTERFIRKLIATGDLRAVKVGTRVVRIRRTDLEDLLRPVRITPRSPGRR
jgi:excisionase family DNA binding protein